MNNLLKVLHTQEITLRRKSFEVSSIIVSFLVAILLALFTLKVGIFTLPLIVSLILLPFLVGDPFRIYLWLIITWPVLTIYARVPLPAGIPDISFERVLIPIILILVLLEGLMKKRRLLILSKLDIFIGIYVLVQIVRFAIAPLIWDNGLLDLFFFVKIHHTPGIYVLVDEEFY